jgi:Leucine-rich repeat (LRR) protein
MNSGLQLQAGGTLNPRQHLYIERREDELFFDLLMEGQYVNVLTSRQMGKSSLMVRTLRRLEDRGVRWVTIDLASELGSPYNLNAYYLGLLGNILRQLRIDRDLKAWWVGSDTETVNQRLLRFFREVVASAIAEPVVIFLDEIDSTLRLSYTDDLFTAIRGMYNERPIVEVYRRMTFCLLGVATPNELIKNRRTTAYNVGTTLELRDFDSAVDDLSPLAAGLNSNTQLSRALLDRVLYWSGGHPYLTQKFCVDVLENRAIDTKSVDAIVTRTFKNLDHVTTDVHFQQILRFVSERLSDESATINLYAKVLKSRGVPDRTTLAHAELKLSGLVKRDQQGKLVVRNPIYERLFDKTWIRSTRPKRALRRTRRFAIAVSVALAVSVGGGIAFYVDVVRPEQERLQRLDRLARLGISITQRDGIQANFPPLNTQTLLREAVPILRAVGQVTHIDMSFGRGVSRTDRIRDLSPLADLTELQTLSIGPSPSLTSLEPLKGLTKLTRLILFAPTGITSLEPLKGLTNLSSLVVADAESIASLEPLSSLTNLKNLLLVNASRITSLEPLRGLTNLIELDLPGASAITSLEPLKGLTNLYGLNLSGASNIASLEPLKELTNLKRLSLSTTSLKSLKELTTLTSLSLYDVSDITSLEPLKGLTNLTSLSLYDARGITSLEPLEGLTNLSELDLPGANGITNLEPLKGLTNLSKLDLTGASGIASLEPLKGLTNLSEINLTEASGITSLEPLKGLMNLSKLDLTRVPRITTLAPLKGKKIEITGASKELLATMK